MIKWYNEGDYLDEKKDALALVKQQLKVSYPEYTFTSGIVEQTFNDYLDISMRLNQPYEKINPAEWKKAFSDIWVTAVYIDIKGITEPILRERHKVGNVSIWDRDQIVFTLNAIRDALKGKTQWNKFYQPYDFKPQLIQPVITDRTETQPDISTATKVIKKAETGIPKPVLYAGAGIIVIGLIYFITKKK